jgi:hypothetical protein
MKATVACVAVVVALSGCGVSTTEPSYNDSLIRQVGAGSLAEASIVAAESRAKALGPFTDASLEKPLSELFRGELNRLTESDFLRMARADVQGRAAYHGYLTTLQGFAPRLRAARIDQSAYGSLSAGGRKFIAVWDESLATLASEFETFTRLFAAASPSYHEFEELLFAAPKSGNPRELARFAVIRRLALETITPLVQHVTMLRQNQVGRSLDALIAKNAEAQAIVRKVNELYPRGLLAETYRSR